MFIQRGFTVKESKECGQGGTMALLTLSNPEEALRALAVMHNYAPEEYKVTLTTKSSRLKSTFVTLDLLASRP
jgi:hypothetical protein